MPCSSHIQAADTLTELLAGKASAAVQALLRQNCVSIGAVVGTYAAVLATGAGNRGHWDGYYGELVGPGRSYRVVQRSLEVLRGVHMFVGDAPAPTQDADGKWRRGTTKLQLLLPPWARSRTWKARPRVDVSPAQPTGHEWPVSRPVTPPDASKPKGTVPKSPVDDADQGSTGPTAAGRALIGSIRAMLKGPP